MKHPRSVVVLEHDDEPLPNQWHVEAGTRDKRRELGMLTVLAPYRSGQRLAWTAERVDTAGRVGVRFTRGGRQTIVTFPAPGKSGEVQVD